jgi:proteasome assembly chaperone (PAC2) family protein
MFANKEKNELEKYKVETQTEINRLKEEAKIEFGRLEAQSAAKDVAGKAIGKYGLMYITIIVLIGVSSSYFLDANAITAVMTMVGGALVALINMLNGIAGTAPKREQPEFRVINDLISRLDQKEPSMKVEVQGDKVTVTKGDDKITTSPEQIKKE